MVMLVSYEQACDHLRIDTEADKPDVMLKIEAASEAVLNYLKHPDDYFDSADEIIDDNIPSVVKKAVLYLTGVLYNDRDANGDWTDDTLPRAVIALLTPLRDPTLA